MFPATWDSSNRARTQDYLKLQFLEKAIIHRLGAIVHRLWVTVFLPIEDLLRGELLAIMCHRDLSATCECFSRSL